MSLPCHSSSKGARSLSDALGTQSDGSEAGCTWQPRVRGLRILTPSAFQIFPLSPDPRWQSSSPRPLALALQQALGQELARVRQGNPEVPGITVRLLQAMATLLSSPHGGTLALAMHHSHFLSCPLMRQLCQYQVLWHVGWWEARAVGDWGPECMTLPVVETLGYLPSPPLGPVLFPAGLRLPLAGFLSLTQKAATLEQGQGQWQGQVPIVEGERRRSLSPLSACTSACVCMVCMCVHTWVSSPLYGLLMKARPQGLVFKPFKVILALKRHAFERQVG